MLRLMHVHAHPDDESSKGAASTAKYVAEGVDVHVATCTGGERGSILNPKMDRPDVLANITEIRRQEMERARDILGVRQDWLGFVDSGCPEGDPKPPLPEGCFATIPLEAAAIRMPAWRARLSDAQVDDLVAYLRAIAASDLPEDAGARTGYTAAERLGCFRCHGPGGRGAGRNPGSLKGYIPPWDGRDFTELVADEAELREWILAGRPRRLQANSLARFFLDRQAIRMPAFRGQIKDEELRALEAYIGWLRRGTSRCSS